MAQRSGQRSSALGPEKPELAWTLRLAEGQLDGLQVSNDGQVYVALRMVGVDDSAYDESGDFDFGHAELYAVDAEGKLLWDKSFKDMLGGQISLLPDGKLLYAGGNFGLQFTMDMLLGGNDSGSKKDSGDESAADSFKSMLSCYSPKGKRLWKKELFDEDLSLAGLGADGSFYVTMEQGFVKGLAEQAKSGAEEMTQLFLVHSLDGAGKLGEPRKFRMPSLRSGGWIDASGNFYLGASQEEASPVQAFGRDGKQLWDYPASVGWQVPIDMGPAFDAAGNSYWVLLDSSATVNAFEENEGLEEFGQEMVDMVMSRKFKLCSLDPQGVERWIRATKHPMDRNVCVSSDGALYYQESEMKPADRKEDILGYKTSSTIHALSAEGKEMWSHKLRPDESMTAAIVDGAGWLYFGTNKGRVVALDSRGRRCWEQSFRDAVREPLAIAKDGSLYFYAGSELHALRDTLPEASTSVDANKSDIP